MQTAPLVLTLQLDAVSQARFDALRREHFPAERNHLQAHVTLFHALPGHMEQQVRDDLVRAARRPPYDVRVAKVRSLGRGVAYDLRSPVLQEQREALARRWSTELTAQDARPHAPHVTVQNKVDPAAARALLQRLREDFVPYDVTATGLALWRYRGGPWEPLSDYPFSLEPPG